MGGAPAHWLHARLPALILLLRDSDEAALLLRAIGLDSGSFRKFVEWALAEHLISAIEASFALEEGFFSKPDALKQFRDRLRSRTRRDWSAHDLRALFERVRADSQKHYREPVPYEEYLKLLWQVPLECARCKRRPPEVVLHIDHVTPASRGGTSLRENLQFLCATDNLRKSNAREVGRQWLDFK